MWFRFKLLSDFEFGPGLLGPATGRHQYEKATSKTILDFQYIEEKGGLLLDVKEVMFLHVCLL